MFERFLIEKKDYWKEKNATAYEKHSFKNGGVEEVLWGEGGLKNGQNK